MFGDMQKRDLSFSTKFIYGIGNLSYSVISQTITNFFMFFGTSVLKISGSLVGIAIALSTLWDGLSDTIIGGISDRYNFLGMGKRNGYMLVATFGMAFTNIFIWNVPIGLPNFVKFLWILICLIVIETFNTMYSTPYLALGNEITKKYHERTKVQIYRTVFFLIGIIIPTVLLYIFLPNTSQFPIGQLNPMGYKKISIITSLICLVFGLLCVFGTLKKSKVNNFKNEKTDKFTLKVMLSDFYGSFKIKELRTLILAYSISMISSTFLTGVGLHFFTYCFFYNTMQITILLATLILGTILSQPLWYILSKRQDKKPALLFAMMFSIGGVFVIAITFILRTVLLEGTFWILLIAVYTCGFGSGALYSLPTSIYADEIDKINKVNGKNRTATYSGVLTLSTNVLCSISLLVLGFLLDIVGFDANLEYQNLSVQTSLSIILFVGVETSLIVGYFLFWKYKDKNKKHKNSYV